MVRKNHNQNQKTILYIQGRTIKPQKGRIQMVLLNNWEESEMILPRKNKNDFSWKKGK